MEPMTTRTQQTIAHLNSVEFDHYELHETLMIILNSVEEYVPRNVVEAYEDLI